MLGDPRELLPVAALGIPQDHGAPIDVEGDIIELAQLALNRADGDRVVMKLDAVDLGLAGPARGPGCVVGDGIIDLRLADDCDVDVEPSRHSPVATEPTRTNASWPEYGANLGSASRYGRHCRPAMSLSLCAVSGIRGARRDRDAVSFRVPSGTPARGNPAETGATAPFG